MDFLLVTKLFSSLIEASMAQAGALVPDGTNLAWTLIGIMIAWQLFQMMILAKDAGESIALIMNMCVKGAFILFLLSSWNGGYVGDFFGATMDQIAMNAAGGEAKTGVQGILNTIDAINRSGSAKIECKEEAAPDVDINGNPTGGGTVANCSGSADGGISVWLKHIANPSAWLLGIAMKFIAIGLLVLLAAVYMLTINVGAVFIGIGMTVGPILVPWYLLPPAEFLFNGWLRFMISASLMKVVGAVLMTIVNVAIVTVKNHVDKTITSSIDLPVADTFALGIVCLITIIGLFLMWQVPAIAGGLVSGANKAGTDKFGSGLFGRTTTNLSLPQMGGK